MNELPVPSFEDADLAAAKLGRQLGHPDWLRGIAVEAVDSGFVLSVRVAPGQVAPALPRSVDGVRVCVTERGLAYALPAK